MKSDCALRPERFGSGCEADCDIASLELEAAGSTRVKAKLSDSSERSEAGGEGAFC